MADSQLHPWDQQPSEPDTAFAWFCAYRSMGPSRSLRRAANLVRRLANPLQATGSNDRAGRGQSFPPGNWTRASVRWRWRERARAYDRHVFGQGLEDVVHAYAQALRAAALRLEKAARRIVPTTYGEVLEGLKLVGAQISPETYDALASVPATKPEEGIQS